MNHVILFLAIGSLSFAIRACNEPSRSLTSTPSAKEVERLLDDLESYRSHREAKAEKRLKQIGKRIIPAIEQRVRNGSAGQRTIWLLKNFPIDDTLLTLTEALSCKANTKSELKHDMFVRMAAATTLGRYHNLKAVPALSAYFDRFRNSKEIMHAHHGEPESDFISAIEALTEIDDQRVLDKCLKELAHPHPLVRFRCAEYLVKKQRPECIPVLIDLLTDTTSLGNVHPLYLEAERTLREFTKQLMSQDPAPRQAEWRKWWRENKVKTPAQWAEQAYHSAARDLISGDDATVDAAIERLATIGDLRSITVLFDFLNDPKHKIENRRRVPWAFAFRRSPYAEQPLIAALKHPDPGVRRAAAYALHNHRSKEGTEALIQALNDDAAYFRAIQGLGFQEDARAVPHLMRFLDHADPEVQRATVGTLGRLGDHSVTPLLLKKLTNADKEMAKVVAEALGGLRDATTFPELLKLLRHEDEWVRSAVNDAIERIADTEFDFYAFGDAKEREADIRAIEAWWEQNKVRLLRATTSLGQKR